MAVAAEEGRERADLHYLVEVVCLSWLPAVTQLLPSGLCLLSIVCHFVCLCLWLPSTVWVLNTHKYFFLA